jgi:hypothetical protein
VTRLPAWALLCCLAACGGSVTDTNTDPTDETLQRQINAGHLALQLERPEEAVARYQDALARAQERDDLAAIADQGYNLAVAELEANHPDKALEVARSTDQEVKRRGGIPFDGLTLVEATALYRTGDLDTADELAKRVAASGDPEAAARATFLRGLIADDHGDETGLAAAAQVLRAATDPSLQADAKELEARLSLRQKSFAAAQEDAGQAAELRQKTLDYRGMARALAVGGEAASDAGDAKAASDLYLRAGRSAAAQGDVDLARKWLEEAARLATGDAVRNEANELLKSLNT